MIRKTTTLALLAVLCILKTAAVAADLPPAGYDKSRDPAADLKTAIAQATEENKRILLEIGGEWCVYCRILNQTIHDDERLSRRLHESFVVVKVNFSPDVRNEAFLSRYPQIPTYPHIFVLEADGKLLSSQTPDAFMQGNRYVPELILAFLDRWAPKEKA